MEAKRELVYEIAEWSQGAPELLESWTRQDILQLVCTETGKDKKYTGVSKLKLIEILLKVVADKKKSNKTLEGLENATKRQRKSDQPNIVINIVDSDTSSDEMKVCKNSACRAKLYQEDEFCKRCSCCICHKYDDNKDPSLWLTCSSEPPYQEKSCGYSCHLECALQHEKSGIPKDEHSRGLDGSFYCISCGKVNDLLQCWRKQMTIARDTRRVDILCYRASLSQRLLSGTVRHENLHKIVKEIIEKLKADVGPLTGLPVRQARGIINRLASGQEVQRLCKVAVECLDSVLSHTHDPVVKDNEKLKRSPSLATNSSSLSNPSSVEDENNNIAGYKDAKEKQSNNCNETKNGKGPPPFRLTDSAHCSGSTGPRRGGRSRRGGGRGGGRDGGRAQSRQGNKNVALRKAVSEVGPQQIEFEVNDKRTYVHVGPNRAWFSNYVGELVRSLPLHHPSWHSFDAAAKAAFMARLGEFFDLTPHMRKPQWKTIKKGIDMYIAKVYSDNKGTMKKQYFTLQGGPPAVEEIRRNPPPNVEPSVWEEHIRFYMKEENLARAAVNKENRKKNKVLSRHGSKSLAAIRHDYFQNNPEKQYPSLIQSYYDTHCDKHGNWMQEEARVNYEEMVRLRDLGADTPEGVAYTDEQILAKVLKGKQRGHIAGVGRVVPGLNRTELPDPPAPAPAPAPEIDDLKAELATAKKQIEVDKKERKAMQKQLDLMQGFMSANPLWHEYLTQAGSVHVDGSGSGAGGSGHGDGDDDGDGDGDGSDDDGDGDHDDMEE